jgi:hypothetical protein
MTGVMCAMAGSTGASGGAPLSATAAPTTIGWIYVEGEYPFYSTDGNITATPAGGTAPYTYLWSTVSGAGSSVTPTDAASFFWNLDSSATTVRCLVTDNLGASAYTNNCSIS